MAALAATTLLLGGVWRESSDANAGSARRPAAAASGETVALVRELERLVRTNPGDARSAVRLGLAYQERARGTGDPRYYPKSERALRRALAVAPRNADALTGLGALALTRHRFAEALALGRRALRVAPSNSQAYGVVGDALLETGRYRDAFAAFDRMAAIKPTLGAYARVAYARELVGNRQGAFAAMRLAFDAAGDPQSAAWVRLQLGKLHASRGELRAAERDYRAALALWPRFADALDAIADIRAATGRPETAIALVRRAIRITPISHYYGALGDFYTQAGRPVLARRAYAAARAGDRVLARNGSDTELETARFDVDHGFRLRDALARAIRGRAKAPSIDGDDTLAWALARNGRCAEARGYSVRALRLGTVDAVKYFHRGMIERCLGNRAAARAWLTRALRVNPYFPQAAEARRALR